MTVRASKISASISLSFRLHRFSCERIMWEFRMPATPSHTSGKLTNVAEEELLTRGLKNWSYRTRFICSGNSGNYRKSPSPRPYIEATSFPARRLGVFPETDLAEIREEKAPYTFSRTIPAITNNPESWGQIRQTVSIPDSSSRMRQFRSADLPYVPPPFTPTPPLWTAYMHYVQQPVTPCPHPRTAWVTKFVADQCLAENTKTPPPPKCYVYYYSTLPNLRKDRGRLSKREMKGRGQEAAQGLWMQTSVNICVWHLYAARFFTSTSWSNREDPSNRPWVWRLV